ncbi:MAG: ABC transporter ATP-binding protein [Zestosphaera sp.]
MSDGHTLLKAVDLRKHYRIASGFRRNLLLRAVDGVSMSVDNDEIVGLLGESGSGKTTLGRLLTGVEAPDAGKVFIEGEELARYLRSNRVRVQMIFQNPDTSLNPRMRVRDILIEALRAGGRDHHHPDTLVAELLEDVGLGRDCADYYPHQLSGGMKQRVAIARALSVRPKFVVADEMVSALDATVKNNILNLVKRLQRQYGFSMLFISHDLPAAVRVSDRVLVMYLGRVVEEARSEELVESPAHPYTQYLLSSLPSLYLKILGRSGDARVRFSGEPPSPLSIPKGCRLHTRCPYVKEVCRRDEPPEVRVSATHKVFCHLRS